MPIGERPMFDRHMETSREEGREEPRFAQRHDTFDLMTDKEFHRAFIRICYYVPLKGAFTPQGIDERVKKKAREIRWMGDHGYWMKGTAEKRASNLEKIVGTSFSTRAIADARRHPEGAINLTLNFGRKKAIDAIIERNMKLRRMMHTRRERSVMRPRMGRGE